MSYEVGDIVKNFNYLFIINKKDTKQYFFKSINYKLLDADCLDISGFELITDLVTNIFRENTND